MKRLTDEELIALAQSATEEEAKPLTQFETFMKDVGAGPGNDWVDAQLIYWRYLDWCEENKIAPKSRYTFSRGINKVYRKGFLNGTVYYVMNKKPFELDRDERVGMRKDWRKEKEYRPWHTKKSNAGKQSGKSKRLQKKLKRQQEKEDQKRKQESQEKTPPDTQD